jgi:predicted amidohydrolase
MTVEKCVRVASAQYTIEYLGDWDRLENKLTLWVDKAAKSGARLLVFPEYAALELVCLTERRRTKRRSPDRHLLGPLPANLQDRRKDLSLIWTTEVIQPFIPRYLELVGSLALRYRTHILAGSLPIRRSDGSLTNTAYFFSPDGGMCSQDKMVLTRWEREVWNMRSGSEARIFDTEIGIVGIDICYDVEFPIIARRQAEAGAQIILAPCCCDSLRGYNRVRVGARARALENQAYVVQSPAIGNSGWLAEFGRCVGFAGIFAPPDLASRENGVVAQSDDEVPDWTFGDINLAAIERIRGRRPVANIDEWTAHMEIAPAQRGKFETVSGAFM